MKSVHQMAMPSPQNGDLASRQTVSEDTRQFVNHIFIELQAAFPAWRQAFPNNDCLAAAKITWMRALVESKVTNKNQIAQGLRMARKSESDFFPSVGKFISWCSTNPQVPDLDSAFEMLDKYIRKAFSAIPKEVRAMFDMINPQTIKYGTASEIYRPFKRNYKFICSKLNNGEAIDEFVIERLPKPKEPELSQEEREAQRLRILEKIQVFKKSVKGGEGAK